MNVNLIGSQINNEVVDLKKENGILNRFCGEINGVYKGILELMSRFGYVSIREVMYGYNLSLHKAFNRIFLKKIGLIGKFLSLWVLKYFYCLTKMGPPERFEHGRIT